jgi:hypothetical protein
MKNQNIVCNDITLFISVLLSGEIIVYFTSMSKISACKYLRKLFVSVKFCTVIILWILHHDMPKRNDMNKITQKPKKICMLFVRANYLIKSILLKTSADSSRINTLESSAI